MSDTERCEFCGAEFDDERDLAWHWFQVHVSEELPDEQFRAATAEFRRRAEEHEFRVEVPVSIPSETWEYIVARERGPEADPAALSPEDFGPIELGDAVADVMDISHTYEVDR